MMLFSVTLVVKEVSEKMAGNGKSLRDEDETDSEFCVCQRYSAKCLIGKKAAFALYEYGRFLEDLMCFSKTLHHYTRFK